KVRSEEAAPPPLPQEEAAPPLPEPTEEPISQAPVQDEKAKAAPKEEPLKYVPPQTLPAATPPGISFLAPTSELPPAYTLLPAPVLALFEKMVSTILVLQNSGITETTIHLNTQEFERTPFADN